MAEANDEMRDEHWSERPACSHAECTASALSFARHCWAHLPDQDAYVESLRAKAASLAGLAGLNLQGARLVSVAGPRPNFAGANLRGADFAGGDFAGADFTDAEMEGATLRGARLAHADFSGADMPFANLRGADLSRARFRETTLTQSDFAGARLSHAEVEDTDLAGACLKDADLAGAGLRRVSLRRADCAGAAFVGARLENCDVGGADLRRADLYGALFRETDLGRAVLPDDLIVKNDEEGKFDDAAEVYAELKLNFRQFGRSGLAETALYREMVARRRGRLRGRKDWRPWALFRHALDFVFLDFYAGYGTKPWRVAYALIGAWALFSLYYYLLPFFGGLGVGVVSYLDPGGSVAPLADLSWASLQRCLYFSFVTLTKLGFTSYEPYGWAKVAAGLEGSFAIVSYTILLVSIARKIWR